MSTAKKRTIKYVSLVASLILVISYFSLLSPTSAYFYKTETKETTITFEMFDVEQTLFENEATLKFKGATKLCDTEELLFDEVAIVKEITVKNNNRVDGASARILVDITPLEKSVENGFRYVAFIEKITNETETVADGEETNTVVSKGAIKTELETLFEIDENSTPEDIEAKIDAHNEALRNTNGNDNKTILAPGESATIRIIFWVEYDNVLSYITNSEDIPGTGESVWQNAGEIVNIEYPCQIRIIATQDNDEAVTDALTEKETTTEATSAEETTEQQ
ncbi:MAG: hypothetical protein E7536_03605 [Ruminococcaceae bacterium]|nr:hypothetical protein [Oscillospiraceae bacterium]